MHRALFSLCLALTSFPPSRARLVLEGVDADAVQHRVLLVRVAAAKAVLPPLPSVDAGESQLGEPSGQHRDELWPVVPCALLGVLLR